MQNSPYQTIKNVYDQQIVAYQFNAGKLQSFHEEIRKQVFEIALEEMKKEYGTPPCKFTWFVTGSAGRFEQAVVSDQDHGIIYETKSEEAKNYFLSLGEKITTGLHIVGYPLCEGQVMSSNPLWCQSVEEWTMQLNTWMEENTFESLRYLLIFYDARVVVGQDEDVSTLKNVINATITKRPFLIGRLMENTKRAVHAIGVFDQLLPIQTGPYTGCINLKQSAIFPFVNAIRLLSIFENIEETSTLSRIESLSRCPRYKGMLENQDMHFKKLLDMRLNYCDEDQYLNVLKLGKQEKQEMKKILLSLKKLKKNIETMIKGVSG